MTLPRTRTEAGPRRTGPRRTVVHAPSKVATTSLDTLRRQLLDSVARHYPQADIEPVGRAFDFAVDALAAAVSRLRKQEKVTEAHGIPTSG